MGLRRGVLTLRLNPLGKRLLRQGGLRVMVRVEIDHGGDRRTLERLVSFVRNKR